jgi:hypothetical protein
MLGEKKQGETYSFGDAAIPKRCHNTLFVERDEKTN